MLIYDELAAKASSNVCSITCLNCPKVIVVSGVTVSSSRFAVLLLYNLAPSRIWPKLSCQESAILDMRSTATSGEVPRPIRCSMSCGR